MVSIVEMVQSSTWIRSDDLIYEVLNTIEEIKRGPPSAEIRQTGGNGIWKRRKNISLLSSRFNLNSLDSFFINHRWENHLLSGENRLT